MCDYKRLLAANRLWATRMTQENPEYFQRLVGIQQPDFLWIGCSDSRVPPDRITQTEPGEIFIHRNVANLVIHTDMNLLSVLQYAVEVLEVKHIIVCGHYGCGGVMAAMGRQSFGIIDQWLRHIKDVYSLHQTELNALPDDTARLNRLVELNIQEQVQNLAQTAIVQQAWKKRSAPDLHGWVYDLHDGLIHTLVEVPAGVEDSVYGYENL